MMASSLTMQLPGTKGIPENGTHSVLRCYSVRAIQGNWVSVTSDNLIAVNRLTAAGMALDNAATEAWTGKRAADYGYTDVEIVGTPVGTPGYYTQVHVLFKVEVLYASTGGLT